MFSNLTNFEDKKSLLEAFGFYLSYLILAVIIGATIGGAIGGFMHESRNLDIQNIVIEIVSVETSVYCLIISLLFIIKKKLYKNFIYILLVPLSCIMALFGGAFLGLIIPAFLSTRQNCN